MRSDGCASPFHGAAQDARRAAVYQVFRLVEHGDLIATHKGSRWVDSFMIQSDDKICLVAIGGDHRARTMPGERLDHFDVCGTGPPGKRKPGLPAIGRYRTGKL